MDDYCHDITNEAMGGGSHLKDAAGVAAFLPGLEIHPSVWSRQNPPVSAPWGSLPYPHRLRPVVLLACKRVEFDTIPFTVVYLR